MKLPLVPENVKWGDFEIDTGSLALVLIFVVIVLFISLHVVETADSRTFTPLDPALAA